MLAVERSEDEGGSSAYPDRQSQPGRAVAGRLPRRRVARALHGLERGRRGPTRTGASVEVGLTIEQVQKRAPLFTFPEKSYNKVFGIGFNKTGTTTLERVLRSLGLQMPNQAEQELRIVRQLQRGNTRPLVEFVARFDAFQDLPFSAGLVFAQVDALFPDSKFILTVREPEAWFESLCRFHCKVYGVRSVAELNEAFFRDRVLYLYKNYTYENQRRIITRVVGDEVVEDWKLLYDKDYRIDHFVRRNEAIRAHFAGRPDDLLVIDLTAEQTVERVLRFLGLPAELDFAMPHLNKTG
jgi:Sulfotransferase domain